MGEDPAPPEGDEPAEPTTTDEPKPEEPPTVEQPPKAEEPPVEPEPPLRRVGLRVYTAGGITLDVGTDVPEGGFLAGVGANAYRVGKWLGFGLNLELGFAPRAPYDPGAIPYVSFDVYGRVTPWPNWVLVPYVALGAGLDLVKGRPLPYPELIHGLEFKIKRLRFDVALAWRVLIEPYSAVQPNSGILNLEFGLSI